MLCLTLKAMPMLNLNATSQFKKDRRRCVKRGYDMSLLASVVNTLLVPEPLKPANKNHELSGNWVNHQECHIQSDWLLIYRIEGDELVLYRTGTHSDLFGK